MLWVGRDLCGSSSPTLPPKQGHLQQAAQDLVQVGLEYISREGDSTAPLGSLFQGSVTLSGKKFFLMFRQNFLCFSLCPLPLSCRWAPLKEFGPILLTPTLQIFVSIYKVLSQPSLIQAKQAQLELLL